MQMLTPTPSTRTFHVSTWSTACPREHSAREQSAPPHMAELRNAAGQHRPLPPTNDRCQPEGIVGPSLIRAAAPRVALSIERRTPSVRYRHPDPDLFRPQHRTLSQRAAL